MKTILYQNWDEGQIIIQHYMKFWECIQEKIQMDKLY